MVITRAIVRDRFSAQEAARLFSLLMLVMGLAPILAPLAGSFLIEWMGWRSVFWSVTVAAVLALILLATGLCFSNSVILIFKLFPLSILGVILFFAGLEMAITARDINEKNDFYILLVTAGFAVWNMGAGFLAGLIMQELFKRRIFKLH